MKKKIITVFLSGFLVTQSCINSFAFAPAALLIPEIAPEILVSIATVATGVGLQLTNEHSIFDLGRMFVDSCKSKGKKFEEDFKKSVSVDVKGVTHMGKEFLNDCKSFFDDTFSKPESIKEDYPCLNGVPIFDNSKSDSVVTGGKHYIPMVSSAYGLKIVNNYVVNSKGEKFFHNGYWSHYDKSAILGFTIIKTSVDYQLALVAYKPNSFSGLDYKTTGTSISLSELNKMNKIYSVPFSGRYDWDKLKVGQNASDGTVGMYVPGNLSSLPGVVQPDVVAQPNVYNPPYTLPQDGTITVPKVSDIPIDIGKSISIPRVGTNVGNIASEGSASMDKTFENTWDIFPPWGQGINFKPVTQINFTDKFPFCLASDIKGIVNIFNVSPKAPVFDVPIVTEKIKIDLSQFTTWANIIKFFVLLGFVLCLINITRKVIG